MKMHGFPFQNVLVTPKRANVCRWVGERPNTVKLGQELEPDDEKFDL